MDKFNYYDVVQALEDDGIMQEPDAPWILEYILQEHGGELDTTSNWARGHEKLLVYSESTADSYDVYVCTHEHNGTSDFAHDVYYNEDHAEWSERVLETLMQGCEVWVADHIWDDMEYDFNIALEETWNDIYEDLHADKVSEMESDGGEYTEDE